jgi:aspartyl protease family protein
MPDNDHNNAHDRRPGTRRGRWVLPVMLLAGVVGAAVLWSAVPDGAELRFVYLVLLGLFVGSGLVWALARAPIGRTLRHAGIWLLIGGVIFVGYSFRDEARYVLDRVQGDLTPQQGYGATETEISFRAGPNGHFLVEAQIDGAALLLVVDTGASDVILNAEDARKLGFDPDTLNYSMPYNTANGTVMGAPLRLDAIRIGPIVLRNVRASVNQAPMNRSLLGVSFLSQIGGYRVSGDMLTLYATSP